MTAFALRSQPSAAFDVELHGRRGLARGSPMPAAELDRLAAWRDDLLARGAQVADELPAFPGTASKLLQLLESKDPEPSALIDIIQTDPLISAQVLKLANSAAFTRGVELTTVHMATTRLGFRTVASVALAASTKALLDQQERDVRECFRDRWRLLSDGSVRVAKASRWLSKSLHRANPEEAFLAGLMLDLGKAVALRIAGAMVGAGVLPATVSAAGLERLLDETHVELGVDLTAVWDLPGYITHACAQHHAPTPARVPINEVLHVVRVASTLDALRTNPFASDDLAAQLCWSADALGLEPAPLATLADALASPEVA
jgi:HD-like signal output (HDOD) protein